jgi:hypothetical protein
VSIRDRHGYTALHLAQINRRVDSVEMIQNETELRQQVQQETEKSSQMNIESYSFDYDSI